jgi:hypothetical protein
LSGRVPMGKAFSVVAREADARIAAGHREHTAHRDGGILHPAAQLLISALLLNTPAFLWYSPVLLLSGTVTGLINGLIATKIIHTVKGMKW